MTVLIIFGGVIFLLNNSNDSSNNIETNTVNNSEISQAKPVISTDSSNKGTYIEYSNDVIADSSGTKILFFHAPWCPQCRVLESDIVEKGVPENVTIIKVDYDSNQPLRQKYGVTLQTTVVLVDDEGNLVNKFVAYDDPSLEAIKQNLL